MSRHNPIFDGDGCPTRSELNAFVGGDVLDGASLKIEQHVSGCPRCMASVEELEEQSDVVVRTLATLPASDDDELEFQQVQSELLAQTAILPGNRASSMDASVGQRSPHVHQPSLPTRLGTYELLEEIGRGATGAVYRVRHQKLDRVFAMKVLYNEQSAEVDSSARFLREMKAIGKLDHPHIVRATDAGDDQGFQYLVMEYSPGLDISEILRRVGPLSISAACEIARQAAMGLQHAHQYGVIHRDVKPSNLLLTAAGQVKLLDLGLVAVRHVQSPSQLERNPRGTADYMAPEQWTDYAHVDERADLYSLGCTLFKMLTGDAPFQPLPKDFESKMSAHLRAEIPRLSLLRADAPPDLNKLLARLLAKRLDDRYQSTYELLKDLTPLAQKANLQELATEVGLNSSSSDGSYPEPHIAANPSAREPISRRAVFLGCAAALSLAAVYGRRIWRSVPKLQTDEWRDLVPISSGFLLAFDEQAKLKHDAAQRSIELTSLEYALVNLGKPLIGTFSIRTSLTLLTKDARAGIFFRYRERLQKRLIMRDFHLLEYLPSAVEGARSGVLQWSHLETSGARMNDGIQRRLLASITAPSNDENLEVELLLGMEGLPGIIWGGKRLPGSAWTLTTDGRQKTQISTERLRDDYKGFLGVLVSNGTAQFHRPQLTYRASHST